MKSRIAVALVALFAALPACNGGNPDGTPTPSPQGPTLDELADRAFGSTEVRHGGRYWAVYLAKGTPQSDVVTAAEAFLDSIQVRSLAGPIDCDRGSERAVKLRKGEEAVAAYFEDEEDARAFAEQLIPPAIAVVKVRTFCAD